MSSGLSKVGDVLGQVADVGGKILSNPLLSAGASAVFGPEAGIGLEAAGKGLSMIRQGSQLAHGASQVGRSAIGASQLARGGNLQGGLNQARSTIEKAMMLRNSAGVAGPSFV